MQQQPWARSAAHAVRGRGSRSLPCTRLLRHLLPCASTWPRPGRPELRASSRRPPAATLRRFGERKPVLVTRPPHSWSLPRGLPPRLRVRRLPQLLQQYNPAQRSLLAALRRRGPREHGAVQRSGGVYVNVALPRLLGSSAPRQLRLLQSVRFSWKCSLPPRRRPGAGLRRLLRPCLSVAQPQHRRQQRAQRRRSRRLCLQRVLAMRSSGNRVLQAACRCTTLGRSGSGRRGVEVVGCTAHGCFSRTTPDTRPSTRPGG